MPSNKILSEPFAILPFASATNNVLAFAEPIVRLPDPTTASIVITLSFNAIVAFAPACNL